MWPNPHIFIEEILNGKLHFLCSAFVQRLHWTDNFWQQLLIKKSYFFGRQILGIWFFLRPVYLFHYSNCSHPSHEVVYLFLSPKEWYHLFFEGFCIYFDRRTCNHPLLEYFFQQYYVYFYKSWFQLCVLTKVL